MVLREIEDSVLLLALGLFTVLDEEKVTDVEELSDGVIESLRDQKERVREGERDEEGHWVWEREIRELFDAEPEGENVALIEELFEGLGVTLEEAERDLYPEIDIVILPERETLRVFREDREVEGDEESEGDTETDRVKRGFVGVGVEVFEGERET